MSGRSSGRILPAFCVLALAVMGSTAAQAQCVGDCNGDGQVGVNEMILGVRVALGAGEAADCPEFDVNGDGRFAIAELVAAVDAMESCQQTPTPTITPPPTPTDVPTVAIDPAPRGDFQQVASST